MPGIENYVDKDNLLRAPVAQINSRELGFTVNIQPYALMGAAQIIHSNLFCKIMHLEIFSLTIKRGKTLKCMFQESLTIEWLCPQTGSLLPIPSCPGGLWYQLVNWGYLLSYTLKDLTYPHTHTCMRACLFIFHFAHSSVCESSSLDFDRLL